jgi:hypothetical protein
VISPHGYEEFPKEVAEQLQYYVYRLIDPRNGQTLLMPPARLQISSMLVEPLQQRGQQQLLRRHRGPTFCGVELTEAGVEAIEGWIRRSGWPAGMRSSIDT